MDAFKFPKRGVHAGSTSTLQINSKVFFFNILYYSLNYWVYGRFGNVFFKNNRWWTKSRNIVISHAYNPLILRVICWFQRHYFFYVFRKNILYCDIHKKSDRIGKILLIYIYIYHYNVTYILFVPTSARGRHWTPKRGWNRILSYLASYPLGRYRHLPHSLGDRTLG